MGKNRLEEAADRSEILQVSMYSLVYRDRGDWDELFDCFHPDAQITTSWFEGNAHEFIEGSSKMMGSHDPADSQKHFAGNPRVITNGDNRAVCEYYLTLHQRRRIDGYLFDFQTWSSTVDMFELRDDTWRVLGRWNIYEKDRMDPHKPGEVPMSFFEEMDLTPYPEGLQYHCWRNARGSSEMPSKGFVIEGTERAKDTRAAAQRWLDGGARPWEE
ncbi:MAG: SnoaL-like domain-containing protein [Rhodospirillales bacterium]|nr:SnoaL-like domain-containing protein [Rhodospirillales bacterium]